MTQENQDHKNLNNIINMDKNMDKDKILSDFLKTEEGKIKLSRTLRDSIMDRYRSYVNMSSNTRIVQNILDSKKEQINN